MTTRILKRETIHQGEMLSLERLEVQLPNGAVAEHETVRHMPGVVVVALLDGDVAAGSGVQVILVRQFRPVVEKEVLELVAGLMDKSGESPLVSAQRELREEVGFEADDWVELGSILSTPGFSDERVTLFLARGLRHVGSDREGTEQLTVSTRPFTLALEEARTGKIEDAKTVIGLFLAALHLEQAASSGL